jgi:hypothetical protein
LRREGHHEIIADEMARESVAATGQGRHGGLPRRTTSGNASRICGIVSIRVVFMTLGIRDLL